MFILVDVNEGATNPKVVERMQKVFPNLELTQLAFGDVNVILDDGNIIAIERKRAGDFLGSIGDGRVFRQVENMSNGAKWCCIIIEGSLAFNEDDMCEVDGEETGWKGVSVRGAMMAIQWSGCPILFTYPENYPNTIVDIISFCGRPVEHFQSLGRKRIVTFPPIEVKEEILSAIPGVGFKRARALLEFCGDGKESGTLAEGLCWASSMKLISSKSRPPGWGDKTAENVRLALGLKENEYLDIKVEGEQNGKANKKN